MWQYYLLPDEEQKGRLTKNPMCNTFPRIGDHVDVDVDELLQKVEKLSKRNSATTTEWLYNLPLERRRQKNCKNCYCYCYCYCCQCYCSSLMQLLAVGEWWSPGEHQCNLHSCIKPHQWQGFSRLHHHRISFHRSELSQVFLVLWWWFIFITLVAFLRIFYRAVQWK